MFLFSFMAQPALCQADSMGPSPLPLQEGSSVPVRLAPAHTLQKHGWSLALGIRGSSTSLSQFITDGSQTQRDELIGPAVDLTMGGAFGITDWATVNAAVPVRVWGVGSENGAGLGDMRLGAGLLVLDRSAFALRISPWLRLPTSTRPAALGSGQVRLGSSASLGVRRGGFDGTLEAGLDARPNGLLPGGPGWRVGLGVGVEIAEPLRLGLESASWGLFANRGRGVGNETLLTLTGRFGKGWGSVTPSTALGGREPGTARFTGLVTAGWSGGPEGVEQEPVPQIVELTVVDEGGRVVRGATLEGSGVSLVSDASGRLPMDREAWPTGAVLVARGLEPTPLPKRPAAGPLELTMAYAPTPLQVRVTDSIGRPVEATVTAHLAGGVDAQRLSVSGVTAVGALSPGEWLLEIAAEGFGGQHRALSVGPRRERVLFTEVVLLEKQGDGTLSVQVVDPQGESVEGARIQVDGVPIGTTASGGAVWIHDLEGESRSLTIRSEHYKEKAIDVGLSKDRDEDPTEVGVRYLQGTVRVRARGPDGPVSDGLLMVTGATALPPMPLGDDGERLVLLDSGTWTMSLSSVALGMQERSIEIASDSPSPMIADFVLQQARMGESDLLVRIQDSRGRPLEGAAVELDGLEIGTTSSGGAIRMDSLVAETHRIAVTHPAIESVEREVALAPGLAEELVTVRWRAGVARVTATAEGEPTDALVVLDGARTIGPEALGDRGQRYFEGLTTGDWELTASTVDFGVQSRTLQVVRPADSLPEAVIRFTGDENGNRELVVRVMDAAGSAVAGAPVSLDGEPVGTTDGAGTATLPKLRAGRRTVEACAAPFRPVQKVVNLNQSRKEVALTCGWDVGATRLEVTGVVTGEDVLFLLAGPEFRPPRSMDGDGALLMGLVPGSWIATFSSPSQGITEVPFAVPDGPELTTVSVNLGGVAGPQLLVRARTRRGDPVVGARVLVDGKEAARTNAAGTAVVEGYPAASVAVTVEAAGYSAVAPRTGMPGESSDPLVFELDAVPSVLSVSVRNAAGQSLDAEVDVLGIQRIPTATTQDGVAEVRVPPGKWEVFVRAEGYGVQRQWLEIAAPTHQLDVELGEALVRRVGAQLRIGDINFSTGRSEIPVAYHDLLKEVAALTLASPDVLRIEAQGHTDATGSVDSNMELSHRRAQAVRRFLLAQGVPPSRVTARGFGPTHPIASNEGEAGRAENRRVAFVVVETVPTQ